MFGYTVRDSDKFSLLFIVGVILHLSLLVCVVDLYFKSPVNSGMEPHQSDAKPFAKRVVLFIADGLRSESIYEKRHENRVPYLKSLRRGRSAWGVVQTRVPTESRPGHVAILAGIYEDPSAIFTGWTKNLVDFDSVINRSTNAFLFGSPDIVTIFPKEDRLFMNFYDPDAEDFSGKTSTIHLDYWVFQTVRELLEKNTMSCGIPNQSGPYLHCDKPKMHNTCKYLCEGGNIYFLHLLGLDSAGHVHKPNSKEYLDNLAAVDQGIEATVALFEKVFNDQDTAYVFTADHGMTDWGSHGDGSDHETNVPYILWGKGIKTNPKRYDIAQADFAPLLASLIGIPIPINSMGTLHPKLLDGTTEQIAAAVHTNIKQLAEHYHIMRKKHTDSTFFVEFRGFLNRMYEIEINLAKLDAYSQNDMTKEIITESKYIISLIHEAIHYLQNYYFYPKMLCIIITFLAWMCFVILNLVTIDNPVYLYDRNHFIVQEAIIFSITFIYFVILVYSLNCVLSYMTIVYISMPYAMLMVLFLNNELLTKLILIWFTDVLANQVCWLLIFMGIIEMLVIGFFCRNVCGAVLILIALWLFKLKVPKDTESYLWLVSCLATAVFLFVTPSTKFNYYGLLIGGTVWNICYLQFLVKNPGLGHSHRYWRNYDLNKIITFFPWFCSQAAITNHFYATLSFYNEEGVFMSNKIISWTLTAISFLQMPFLLTRVLPKLYQIACCLFIPFALMSINYDILFYTLLTVTLYYWVLMETKISHRFINIHELYFGYHFLLDTATAVGFETYRRTLFYLALCICYFFGVGNVASFNGFDPLWTKDFISTFSPFTMCILIVFKMAIPYFLITCSFVTINVISRANETAVFSILFLMLDQMVLNFMMFITNEGSWRDIGMSISHFVIMEVMVIIMLFMYVIAKRVLTFPLENYLKIHYRRKVDRRQVRRSGLEELDGESSSSSTTYLPSFRLE